MVVTFAWMLPGEILLIRLVEKRVGNAGLLLCTGVQQELPIGVLFPLAKLANEVVLRFPVHSDSSVEVS